MKQAIYLLAVVVTLLSCKNETKTTTTVEQPTEAKTVNPNSIKGNKYTLTPFAPSTEYADAKIDGYTYKDGTFKFDVSGAGYELGQQTPDASHKMCANSGKGQHIHLIVDREPYAAKYTDQFDYEISDGEHYLLAFLSRSYHESIKSKGAAVAKIVTVKDNTITDEKDIADPILFYSRPKGTYVGEDTKKVMLDFYLSNVNLQDGYKVRANINGDIFVLDKWQPYYIEGLPIGNNIVVLSLIDKDGNEVSTPLTPVSRKFVLKETAEEK